MQIQTVSWITSAGEPMVVSGEVAPNTGFDRIVTLVETGETVGDVSQLVFVIRTLSVQANYTVIFLSGRKSLLGIPRLNNRKSWVGFGTRFRLLYTSATLRDLSSGNITILISLLRSCSRIMAPVNLLLSLLLVYDQGLFPLWVKSVMLRHHIFSFL